MAMFTTASTSKQDEWKDIKRFWDWGRVAQKQSKALIRNCIKWEAAAWSRREREVPQTTSTDQIKNLELWKR